MQWDVFEYLGGGLYIKYIPFEFHYSHTIIDCEDKRYFLTLRIGPIWSYQSNEIHPKYKLFEELTEYYYTVTINGLIPSI